MFQEDYLVLLHIATTADEHEVCVTRQSAEIVEVAWSIIATSDVTAMLQQEDAQELTQPTVLEKASVLVRPCNSPVTDLCTSTTGLTWGELSEAGSLVSALQTWQDSIKTTILAKKATFAFVVLDADGLQVQLIRETREKHINLPEYLSQPRFYCIFEEFKKRQSLLPDVPIPSSFTYASVCETLSITMPQHAQVPQNKDQFPSNLATGYRAGHKCSLLLSIITRLLQEPMTTGSLFEVAIDAGADLRVFSKEESKVLHLSGLSHDTTQSELESWFTQHGGRPVAFWTLRTPEQHRSTGIGFAVFATHEEAKDSLAMNGRSLADCTVKVSPSSARILDRAGEILTPFPPSKNRPRPGDWTCPSCGFSNFQRRTACFRCSYPASSALDSGPYYGMHTHLSSVPGYPSIANSQNMNRMGATGNGSSNGGHVPFRAGDWSCPTCAYHNFARNSVCLKCSMPRTQQEMNGINGYIGYDPGYRMGALTDDMARQML